MTETELLSAIAGGPLGFAGKDMLIGTTAEVAECTCPDFCERDHERD